MLRLSMPLTVLGPGLVGSFLGAAADAERCIPRPGDRRPLVRRVRLPAAATVLTWRPQPATLAGLDAEARLLVATGIPDTPWDALPARALAAQNGLGQPRAVVTCFLALDVGADGAVRHAGPPPRLVLADPGPAWAGTIAAWRAAGLLVEVVDDPRPAQWEKAILNATVGPLCLATGLGMGEVWADPVLRTLTQEATDEGIAIARANGIPLDPGLAGRAAGFFARVGDHRPSLLRHAGELPWVLGHLLRAARRAGVASPALARIDGLVTARAAPAADR